MAAPAVLISSTGTVLAVSGPREKQASTGGSAIAATDAVQGAMRAAADDDPAS